MNVGINKVVGVEYKNTGEFYCIKCALSYFIINSKELAPTLSELLEELATERRQVYWRIVREKDYVNQLCVLCG
uniref:Uncharacterized protein n=1 Tax=viral metagenome TaxID=1070528 RepID=A0A6M3LXB5_9ZZZZ